MLYVSEYAYSENVSIFPQHFRVLGIDMNDLLL